MNQRRLHYILTVVIMTVCILQTAASCARKDSTYPSATLRLEQLRREATSAASMNDFSRSDSIGLLLYREAEAAGNDVYMTYGLLCQSFYTYTSQGADERLKTLKEAERLALDTKNDSLLSRVYNVLGTYSVAYTHNFEDSKRYFTEAIRYARQAGAPDFAIAGECNLSELYRRRGDTLGIKYDIDIYDYADKVGNRDLLLSAAQHCAEYYLKLPGKTRRALPYIDRIKEEGDSQLYHILHAHYLFASDSVKEAEREYATKVNFSSYEPQLFLNYGNLLNRTGKFEESTEMLLKAEAAYELRDPYNASRITIYQLLADNNDRIGNHKEAYRNLQRYFTARDSLDEVRKLDDMQRFKVKFNVEKKELALQHERENSRLKNILIGIAILVLLLTIGGFSFYIRRRNRLHRIIVERHLENIRRLSVESQADVSDESGNTPETPSSSSCEKNDRTETQNGLSAKKREEIWKAVMAEIDDNKIHTDPQLSRDSFAEKVGCNHTWLSQVIKIKTGKSYTQFINSLRVDEAIRLLSAIGNDLTQREVAAKSGFMSPSSFYTAFRLQVGMSPTEYKRQVEDIGKSPEVS